LYTEYASKRIVKIGYYLAKIGTKVCGLLSLGHPVYHVVNDASLLRSIDSEMQMSTVHESLFETHEFITVFYLPWSCLTLALDSWPWTPWQFWLV